MPECRRNLEQADQNVVTVACTVCTGTYWLMPRLAEFYAQHPDIVVRVVLTSTTPRFTAEVDLLIRYGAGDWPDGKSEPLFSERMIPLCSPKTIERLGSGNFLSSYPPSR
ncbi:LysR substrate-binding domain-containing protein [Aurantimonas sp. VKM B-3413]|uniref:LysR substrate-binding domain-containing protein n=1 Tax=Aurantimonas sp. VKM B-3413 TaxID=2779401 RepID=UPI00351D3154|nr:hypothetical protein [Aurantimonas sp. VKM B-3413]